MTRDERQQGECNARFLHLANFSFDDTHHAKHINIDLRIIEQKLWAEKPGLTIITIIKIIIITIIIIMIIIATNICFRARVQYSL